MLPVPDLPHPLPFRTNDDAKQAPSAPEPELPTEFLTLKQQLASQKRLVAIAVTAAAIVALMMGVLGGLALATPSSRTNINMATTMSSTPGSTGPTSSFPTPASFTAALKTGLACINPAIFSLDGLSFVTCSAHASSPDTMPAEDDASGCFAADSPADSDDIINQDATEDAPAQSSATQSGSTPSSDHSSGNPYDRADMYTGAFQHRVLLTPPQRVMHAQAGCSNPAVFVLDNMCHMACSDDGASGMPRLNGRKGSLVDTALSAAAWLAGVASVFAGGFVLVAVMDKAASTTSA